LPQVPPATAGKLFPRRDRSRSFVGIEIRKPICCSNMTTAVPLRAALLQKRQESAEDQRPGPRPSEGFVARSTFGRDARPAQRHHLLLPPLRSRAGSCSFFAQDRKHLERRTASVFERRPAAMHRGAEADVVGDGEVWKTR